MCRLCHHVNAVGFATPDRIWNAIVPEHAKNWVVCLSCFARLGDEKAIAWDDDIKLYPVSLATHHGIAGRKRQPRKNHQRRG